MKVEDHLPEETMIQRALEALMAALGPIETARFLSLPRRRYRDYVMWHREWQESLDVDRFLDDVFTAGESTGKQV
jgi:hypothetical protein